MSKRIPLSERIKQEIFKLFKEGAIQGLEIEL